MEDTVSENAVVVFAGGSGTGKSSLIQAAAKIAAAAAAKNSFSSSLPQKIPPVLPPTVISRLFFPPEFCLDSIPLTLTDTSSSSIPEQELRQANGILLTYAANDSESLNVLEFQLLPLIRRLKLEAPVMVVCCKSDTNSSSPEESRLFEELATALLADYPQIQACVRCSATNPAQVRDLLCSVHNMVRFPVPPIFDHEIHSFKPGCARALKRIFQICDVDGDGALSDEELGIFQLACFGVPLQPENVAVVRKMISQRLAEGYNDHGLTVAGFMVLHFVFLETGKLESFWTVLRRFGYGDDLEPRDEVFPRSLLKRRPDQSVELSNEGLGFLMRVFAYFDLDGDGSLCWTELQNLFSTAPWNPWEEKVFMDSEDCSGTVSVDVFVRQWQLMILVDPVKSLKCLTCIGCAVDPATLFCINRSRSIDIRKNSSERNAFQCFVFGSAGSGKSALLNSLGCRAFGEKKSQPYATNTFKINDGTEKFLVLREIPENELKILPQDPKFLSPCDVGVFAYDSSDPDSWKETAELLSLVTGTAENTGFNFPCMIVAAKTDLGCDPDVFSEAKKMAQDLEIVGPVAWSSKEGNTETLFGMMIETAENPRDSIPQTKTVKRNMQRSKFLKKTVTCACLGVAVAAVALGVATYFECEAAETSDPQSVNVGLCGKMARPFKCAGICAKKFLWFR